MIQITMFLTSNAAANFLLEVLDQVEIRRLRQPVKNGDFIILESFIHEAKCMLGVIVLLDKPPNRHLLFRMGQHVCLQDVPVLGDVHNSLSKWVKMSLDQIVELVDSMPSCCAAVIQANGFLTKYLMLY